MKAVIRPREVTMPPPGVLVDELRRRLENAGFTPEFEATTEKWHKGSLDDGVTREYDVLLVSDSDESLENYDSMFYKIIEDCIKNHQVGPVWGVWR